MMLSFTTKYGRYIHHSQHVNDFKDFSTSSIHSKMKQWIHPLQNTSLKRKLMVWQSHVSIVSWSLLGEVILAQNCVGGLSMHTSILPWYTKPPPFSSLKTYLVSIKKTYKERTEIKIKRKKDQIKNLKTLCKNKNIQKMRRDLRLRGYSWQWHNPRLHQRGEGQEEVGN